MVVRVRLLPVAIRAKNRSSRVYRGSNHSSLSSHSHPRDCPTSTGWSRIAPGARVATTDPLTNQMIIKRLVARPSSSRASQPPKWPPNNSNRGNNWGEKICQSKAAVVPQTKTTNKIYSHNHHYNLLRMPQLTLNHSLSLN